MRTTDLKRTCNAHDHWALYERLIGQELKERQTILSPLRNERTPSFGIYRSRKDGLVRFKDFGGEDGDIYEFVMQLNDHRDFPLAVDTVARLLGVRPGKYTPPTMHEKVVRVPQLRKPARCWWTYRPDWSDEELAYWHRFGTTETLLNRYDVLPVSSFTLINGEGKEMRWMRQGELMFVFPVGDHGKLYMPERPKGHRYIGNTDSSDVFGLKQLKAHRGPMRPRTVITAGQKDALTAIAQLDVHGVSFNSENYRPTQAQMLDIVGCSEEVYILYDNDPTGLRYMQAICAVYPFVRPIELRQYTTAKDLSNVAEANDRTTLHQLCHVIHGHP